MNPIKMYYRKVKHDWLTSSSRAKTYDKRGIPKQMEFKSELTMVYVIYTLLMPLVLLDWFIGYLINNARRNKK